MAEKSLAPLTVIDFTQLLHHNASEADRLLKACETYGFFYLDLQGDEGQAMLADWQSLLRTTEKYFDQPNEIKFLDDRKSGTYGFKRIGTMEGAVAKQVDAQENLKISRDEILQMSSNLPVVVKENQSLFHRFVSESHLVITTVLENLSNALGLTPGARFEEFHRETEPSKTLLGLLRYPKQDADSQGVGLHKHTDTGSLTIVLTEQWGLQVLLPDREGWHFVAPRAGHAVINVGDMLRFLSGQRFHSCVHRVLPVTARQEEDKYSIIYLMRTENQARFRDHESRELTAAEWHARKVNASTDWRASNDTALTGGMEKNDALLGMVAPLK